MSCTKLACFQRAVVDCKPFFTKRVKVKRIELSFMLLHVLVQSENIVELCQASLQRLGVVDKTEQAEWPPLRHRCVERTTSCLSSILGYRITVRKRFQDTYNCGCARIRVDIVAPMLRQTVAYRVSRNLFGEDAVPTYSALRHSVAAPAVHFRKSRQ